MRKELKGALSLILAVVLYGMYGVYSRKIGLDFGAFSQNWIRNLIIVAILAVYFFLNKKDWVKIKKEDIGWMSMWALSGAGVMVLLFVVFNYIPIGTSYFLLYSAMVISGYVSGRLFYKEKIDTIKAISVMLALIGLAIVYSLDIPLDKAVYVLAALLSGVLTGLWNTLSKKVSSKYPNFQLVCIDAFVAFVVGVLGALLVRESMPTLELGASWIWLFIFALTQIGTVGLVIYGFRHLEAQIGSIIMPTEVVFATLFGFLFFKEILPLTTILGGILIAFAAVLPSFSLLFSKSKLEGMKKKAR